MKFCDSVFYFINWSGPSTFIPMGLGLSLTLQGGSAAYRHHQHLFQPPLTRATYLNIITLLGFDANGLYNCSI